MAEKKQTRLAEGIFWVVIGAAIGIMAYRFDLGSLRSPGPGFITFLAGMLICGMGVAIILMGARTKEGGQRAKTPVIPAPPWLRLGWTVSLLAAYAILMEPLGYILSTVLVMFGLFFDSGKKNWLRSLFFSIITTMISYLIFEVWLSSQLPRGLFPWW